MNPILFNTDMVRAILDNRKTVTRRVVKLKYSNTHLEMFTNKYGTRLVEKQNEEPGITTVKNPDGTTTHKLLACIEKTTPYHPGDILYVRETFFEYKGHFYYKADGKHEAFDSMLGGSFFKWRPSIHMPREAARIFLRVTNVKVERLLDMSKDDAVSEGCDPSLKDIAPDLVYYRIWCEMESIWNSTIKHADRAIYGWDANPWVWVIEFERISKEEAMQ